jgi:hypothetical protein
VLRINSELKKISEVVKIGATVKNYPIVLTKATKQGELIASKEVVLPAFCYEKKYFSHNAMNEIRHNVSSVIYTLNLESLQGDRAEKIDALATSERERSEAEERRDDKTKYSFMLKSASLDNEIKILDSRIKALNLWAENEHITIKNVDTLSSLEKSALFWLTVGGQSNKFKDYKFAISSNYELYVHGLNMFSVVWGNKGIQNLSDADLETVKLFRTELELDIKERFEVPAGLKLHVTNDTVFRIYSIFYKGVKKDKNGKPCFTLIREREFMNTIFREEVSTVYTMANMQKKKNGKILMKL